MTTDHRLLPSSFLFRFEIPLHRQQVAWSDRGVTLPETCRLPPLTELENGSEYADLRLAWDGSGLTFSMRVGGKKHLPWCRETRPVESDGLHLCLDTRNTPEIHRANRFCHRFVFSPYGAGPRRDQPFARLVHVDGARESPQPVEPEMMRVASETVADGYCLSGQIPAAALTGFDPEQYDRVSLFTRIADRELGEQRLTLDGEFRVLADPSLWVSAVLVD